MLLLLLLLLYKKDRTLEILPYTNKRQVVKIAKTFR